ncbi:MAG: tRNA pseudouridine(38-40) synthase TruA [Phycisphaeraceae bacterium]|nr:tRNA pseudouridine(38-40) synthase TruA [Phycisphaeraceae bacterium]
MTVAYDGSEFHGWQRQTTPEGLVLRTVAGELESIISRVLRQPVMVQGASRTDAGVHARGQVASFVADSPVPVERMERAINSRLPPDLEIRDLAIAHRDFHPIRDALRKQYRYRLHHSLRRPLEKRRFVWHCWYDLDIAKMRDAAARLIGRHDFAGFAQADHGRASTVRTIMDCRIEIEPPEIHLLVIGDGFLYNMVRIIAGTVVEAGRGRIDLARIDRALTEGDRRLAGPTLPPEGLWLEWIEYPDPPSIDTDPSARARQDAQRSTEAGA